MGKVPRKSNSEFDAEGKAIAPVFVDIHTHYDAQIMWDPMLSYSPWRGVATRVIGNCGFGVAPVRPKYREIILRTLEKGEAMSYEALTKGLNPWLFETLPEYLDVIDAKLGSCCCSSSEPTYRSQPPLDF